MPAYPSAFLVRPAFPTAAMPSALRSPARPPRAEARITRPAAAPLATLQATACLTVPIS